MCLKFGSVEIVQRVCDRVLKEGFEIPLAEVKGETIGKANESKATNVKRTRTSQNAKVRVGQMK